MSDRRRSVYVLLSICIVILLLVFLKIPSLINSDPDVKIDAKVLEEAQDARLKETIQKFVKSIGNIEARMQTLEDKVNKIQKEEKREEKADEPDNNIEVGEQKDDHGNRFTGEIKQGSKCLDSAEQGEGGAVLAMDCHKKGRNQFFELKGGKIRHKGFCLAVDKAESKAKVILRECNQQHLIEKWSYHDEFIQAEESGFCMETNNEAIVLEKCDETKKYQKWSIHI